WATCRASTGGASEIGSEVATDVAWAQRSGRATSRCDLRSSPSGGLSMNSTRLLRDAGQSLWLDNITRGLLTSGGLPRSIDEFAVTGLTPNPTIFDHAIRTGHDYDAAIRENTAAGIGAEKLFFELALQDLRQAANLFRPFHAATNCVDGWVSLEVSMMRR